MRLNIILWALIFLNFQSYSQKSLSDSLVNNKFIKYDVFHVPGKLIDKNTSEPRKILVVVTIDTAFKNILIKENRAFWMDKLTNEKSDWAAELILYDLYNRNALAILAVNNDRKNWLKIKKKEIQYWGSFLK